MPTRTQATPPSPEPVFAAMWAYQQTEALRAAIELDLFTAIGSGAAHPAALAERTRATERGVRILCDFLTIQGLLSKHDGTYELTPAAANFLDRRSPAFMGDMMRFIAGKEMQADFRRLAQSARGEIKSTPEVDEPNWRGWIEFARSMTPLMRPQSEFLASRFAPGAAGTVLDVAAGHGLFGIAFARHNPDLNIIALDWPEVLTVAKEHAAQAGLDASRYRTLSGSALEIGFGENHRFVLLTNFLHHFDSATCERLLRKAQAALQPGGQVVVLEFVPNDDRVSPPFSAAFSLTMLASTPRGDAYTWQELLRMLQAAGFDEPTIEPVPHSPQSAICARRKA